MNILKRELRANLKALIIWSSSMIFLIYTSMVKYSGYANSGQSINETFRKFPAPMKAIVGLGEFDITTALGYYAVCYFYFILLAGIHAVMLGCIIIAKEERDKTADFIFTKPVSRSKVITFKLIAVLVNLMIFNLITLFSSIIFVYMFNTGKPINYEIFKLMLSLFFVQLIFASFGAFAASIIKNINRAASFSTSVLLVTFMISIAIDLYSKINFLKYLTPFKYFTAVNVIKSSNYDLKFIIISFVLISIFIYLTYIFTNKKDIHV